MAAPAAINKQPSNPQCRSLQQSSSGQPPPLQTSCNTCSQLQLQRRFCHQAALACPQLPCWSSCGLQTPAAACRSGQATRPCSRDLTACCRHSNSARLVRRMVSWLSYGPPQLDSSNCSSSMVTCRLWRPRIRRALTRACYWSSCGHVHHRCSSRSGSSAARLPRQTTCLRSSRHLHMSSRRSSSRSGVQLHRQTTCLRSCGRLKPGSMQGNSSSRCRRQGGARALTQPPCWSSCASQQRRHLAPSRCQQCRLVYSSRSCRVPLFWSSCERLALRRMPPQQRLQCTSIPLRRQHHQQPARQNWQSYCSSCRSPPLLHKSLSGLASRRRQQRRWQRSSAACLGSSRQQNRQLMQRPSRDDLPRSWHACCSSSGRDRRQPLAPVLQRRQQQRPASSRPWQRRPPLAAPAAPLPTCCTSCESFRQWPRLPLEPRRCGMQHLPLSHSSRHSSCRHAQPPQAKTPSCRQPSMHGRRSRRAALPTAVPAARWHPPKKCLAAGTPPRLPPLQVRQAHRLRLAAQQRLQQRLRRQLTLGSAALSLRRSRRRCAVHGAVFVFLFEGQIGEGPIATWLLGPLPKSLSGSPFSLTPSSSCVAGGQQQRQGVCWHGGCAGCWPAARGAAAVSTKRGQAWNHGWLHACGGCLQAAPGSVSGGRTVTGVRVGSFCPRVRAALEQGGGRVAEEGGLCRGATHVVCQPDAALKWLSMGELHTLLWLTTTCACLLRGESLLHSSSLPSVIVAAASPCCACRRGHCVATVGAPVAAQRTPAALPGGVCGHLPPPSCRLRSHQPQPAADGQRQHAQQRRRQAATEQRAAAEPGGSAAGTQPASRWHHRCSGRCGPARCPQRRRCCPPASYHPF